MSEKEDVLANGNFKKLIEYLHTTISEVKLNSTNEFKDIWKKLEKINGSVESLKDFVVEKDHVLSLENKNFDMVILKTKSELDLKILQFKKEILIDIQKIKGEYDLKILSTKKELKYRYGIISILISAISLLSVILLTLFRKQIFGL